MTNLPITHMTLYKHGVGFYERRGEISGEEVELSFGVQEMNDILKSLTAIDWGGGQVLGIDYATPQSIEERLSGCSVRMADDRSLRDLLISLRGRRVRLLLDQAEEVEGTLLGLDEAAERQPLSTCLVSILVGDKSQARVVEMGRVQGMDVLDKTGASDLSFYLQTALSREDYRQVTVRLTPGSHDLAVSYIAPAPTWRVSYRLVVEDASEGDSRSGLLLGWGIFDNRLEEDLERISLSLVAGMPISFIYDLYTPHLPARPLVEEEDRVAAAPVEFEEVAALHKAKARKLGMGAEGAREPELQMARTMAMAPPPSSIFQKGSMDDLIDSAPVMTEGESLGELFQYTIGTPVTVGRGHSAMVPIVSTKLSPQKDLIYNGHKMPTHPVATLRLTNATSLTLERGPVTVIEGGEYVGEAVLPFTPAEGEIVVPYAVELGVKVRESAGIRRAVCGLEIKGAYLLVEEWETRWREYQLGNSTANEATVLVEHPRLKQYELFETSDPVERTEKHLRFEVCVPARDESVLRVQERRLLHRKEKLVAQSYKGLRRYTEQGLLDGKAYQRLVELLRLLEEAEQQKARIEELAQERKKIYASQKQIQSNMSALSHTGKEGALRAGYVDQLESSEERLRDLEQKEREFKAEIDRLEREIDSFLEASR